MAGAIVHGASDDLPVLIWADTSFLFAVCNSLDPGHLPAWALYERIRAAGVPILICKPLLQLEFWSALRTLARSLKPRQVERLIYETELRLGGPQTLRLRTIDRSDPQAVRQHVLAYGERLLWSALETVPVVFVRFGQKHVTASRRWIGRYDLKSLDALHVELLHSVAGQAGVEPAMATLDADFLVVNGLHVWSRPVS